ncbi:MAG TPA: CDP-diacylglycerol--glycerol-3-phosphate 3-phosphatidyltransferase [Rhizomicrobium sp.]|jgi:CDP-diacylglycerol--glycerol-3-phosphate 3-phosphatidyltransferase|nr:CDP-diacylglycerol--glycerol-3-phosphate 3-phosphatidyltransferase [Rhizomicrobium sp.]
MFGLANLITIGRIVLVPVFVVAFWLPGDVARFVAFVVFCIAGASDALDGLVARKLNTTSDFGRMLDPIADKILVAVALMLLVADNAFDGFKLYAGVPSIVRLIPAIVILSREILVSGLREFLAGAAVSIPVTRIAKFKTTIQMVAIGAMILGPIAENFIPGSVALAYVVLWIAAGLTVYTGFIYFRAGMVHARTDGVTPRPRRGGEKPLPTSAGEAA